MKHWANFYKSLSDPIRLKILGFLIKKGETCVCDVMTELNVPQSKLSYHIKLLHDAGLLNVKKKGKWNYYSINMDQLLLKVHPDFIKHLQE